MASRCTLATVRAICARVEAGMNLKAAAGREGVAYSTVKLWKNKGEDILSDPDRAADVHTLDAAATDTGINFGHLEQLDDTLATAVFAWLLVRARAQAEGELELSLHAAGLGDWRAAAWKLERANTEEWGPPETRVDVTSGGKEINVIVGSPEMGAAFEGREEHDEGQG